MPEQPSITIPGVPETIKRADYLALIRGLGLDPNVLSELTLGPRTIHAVVRAQQNGHDYLDPLMPNEIAKHHIVIRIED